MLEHSEEQFAARIVTTDPRVANPRAVRCYEKAGFERVRIVPYHEFHEGEWCECWLMVFRQVGSSGGGERLLNERGREQIPHAQSRRRKPTPRSPDTAA